MKRTIEMELEYQPMIAGPPMQPEKMYDQACASDDVTINTWRDIWISNYKAAKERFGTFQDKTFGLIGGSNRHQPVICLASGPSLRESFPGLRKNQAMKYPILVISALHNFALLKDEGIKVNYWVSMDSGDIVLDDTIEFGSKDQDFYWSQTEGETLLAVIASPPRLFDRWKGKVLLFNSKIGDPVIAKAFNDSERVVHYISSGGNVGGGVSYIGKAVLGSNPVILCGYDFCFSYDQKFHPVKTKYDNFNGKGIGQTMDVTDVFENRRRTWPSYWNFKLWQEFIALKVPGIWINCSEGILGSYREGNIRQFLYMPLDDAVEQYRISDEVTIRENAPDGTAKEIEFDLSELWKNPQHEKEVTLF